MINTAEVGRDNIHWLSDVTAHSWWWSKTNSSVYISYLYGNGLVYDRNGSRVRDSAWSKTDHEERCRKVMDAFRINYMRMKLRVHFSYNKRNSSGKKNYGRKRKPDHRYFIIERQKRAITLSRVMVRCIVCVCWPKMLSCEVDNERKGTDGGVWILRNAATCPSLLILAQNNGVNSITTPPYAFLLSSLNNILR